MWRPKCHQGAGDYMVPLASARLKTSKLVLHPQCHYVYVEVRDCCVGLWLRAVFDTNTMQHKAYFRRRDTHSLVEAQHDEVDARHFLVVMRPFVKVLQESMVHLFLRNFTCVNAVTWDEAKGILCGDMMEQQEQT